MDNNINLKLRRYVKGETQHWMPAFKEAKLLWCHFIGFTFWPGGYWITHSDNRYVNVQVVEQGCMTVYSSCGKTVVPAGAAVIIPPGECKLEASGEEGVSKKHMSIMGSLCLQSLGALGFEQITVLHDFSDRNFMQEFETICRMAAEKNPDEIFDYTSRVCKIMFLLADRIRSRNLPQTFVP